MCLIVAVCDRAVQDFADQHAAHLDVGDERGLALGQLDRVDLRLRHADVPGLGRRREDQLGQIDLHLRVRPRAGGLRRLDRFRRGLRQFHQVDRWVQAADHRRGFLAAQPGGRAQHRLHRPDVAGAAAQHAGERLAHLGLGGIRILLQQRIRGQELRRGAVAALDRAGLDERLLQRVEAIGVLPALFGVLAQPFDGVYRVAIRLRRQHGARRDRNAVEQH